MNDVDYMNMAIELARKGEGYTSPNPMVGAIVVKNGEIVGQGYHEAAGKPHAEVNAINAAGSAADGATLYVTLEPCNHTGRTPPCTEKIIASGIKRVVIAMRDPNPKVKGGGYEYLKSKGIQVDLGVCEQYAQKLNEAFIKFITTDRPFVILKCAATLDGRIATRTGDSRWVSGEASRQYVHRLRHALDAIMVGIGTVRTDNPQLTTRLDNATGKDPIRIILDTNLSIPEDATVLTQQSKAKTIIVTGNDISEEKRKRLALKPIDIIQVQKKNNLLDLHQLMDILGSMQIMSLLIEGGSRVIGSALREQIVDKVIFCYAPKILGGDDGIPICRGQGAKTMKDCIRVKNIQVHRFDEDVMIEGYL